ncbi:g13433 [Coccomyxa viridis]|uniref:G13433 protein n=1 Tax=Coccomyxa viridis TaxID=1274662 RepID=A0ABP1GCS2_9CHLO
MRVQASLRGEAAQIEEAALAYAVAIGSEAQEAGIRPGQQLLSISDPIRNDEVWKISIETKLSRVRDALQFRSPPTINLQLTESSIEDEAGFVWGSGDASASQEASGSAEETGSQQDLLTNITGGAGEADDAEADRQTLADRLEQQQSAWKAKAAAEEAKYKARVQQRRDYMERESGRNDSLFFALLFSFFVLPAAVILIVAWQTGYLASLDTNQHF